MSINKLLYIFSPPIELPDVSGYPLLLAELTRDRRWSALDIKKLVGGNLLRVLKEVENHATIMSHQSPAEELIPQELIEDTAYCRYQDTQKRFDIQRSYGIGNRLSSIFQNVESCAPYHFLSLYLDYSVLHFLIKQPRIVRIFVSSLFLAFR